MQTYLLKMARSGEEGEKTFLLLEAGVRLHTTEACLSLQHCPAVLCRLFGRVACVIPPKDTPTAGNGCAPPVQPASSTALKCALLQLACAVLGGGGGVLVCGHTRLVSSLCGAGTRAEVCMCADAGGEERPALQLCAEAAETPAQPQVSLLSTFSAARVKERTSIPPDLR